MMVSYRFVAKCIVFLVFLGFLGNASSCIIGDSKACVIPKDSSQNPCAAHLQCIEGWCLPPKFAGLLEKANLDASVVDTPATDGLADTPVTEGPSDRTANPDVVAEQNEPVESPTKDEGSPDVVTQDTCPSACEAGKEQPCYPNEKGCDTATSKCTGVCMLGKQLCEQDANGCLVWGACNGAVTPTAEDCDGADNDCNGQIDDVTPRECYSGAADTKGKGPCKAGVQACVGGQWEATCTGEVIPTPDQCDGNDADCDGKIDNGCVSTFAGDGTPGLLNGNVTVAQFNRPYRILFDSAGNLLVTEQMNPVIRKVDTSGQVTTFVGTTRGHQDGAASVAKFSSPCGMVFDTSGLLYVADFGSHAIRKVTASGDVSTLVGQASAPGGNMDGAPSVAKFNGPCHLAIDASNNLYVTDQFNYSIRKIDNLGTVSTYAGTGVSGYKDGAKATAQFEDMFGLIWSRSGDLYVSEQTRIRKIDLQGNVTTLVGPTGSSATIILDAGFITNFTFDSSQQYLYFSIDAHAIARLEIGTNKIQLLSGNRMMFGFQDGPVGQALFYGAFGFAFDKGGALFVADSLNHRIRKVVLP